MEFSYCKEELFCVQRTALCIKMLKVMQIHAPLSNKYPEYLHLKHCGGLVTKSYPTLATPWTEALLSMGFSRQEYWSRLPFSFFRKSSEPRKQTWVSSIAGRFFDDWATREAQNIIGEWYKIWLNKFFLFILEFPVKQRPLYKIIKNERLQIFLDKSN